MLVLLLLFCVLSFAAGETHTIIKDYARPHKGWISIRLTDYPITKVTSIQYCGTAAAVSKDLGMPSKDLKECQAAGLMHKTLFPPQRGSRKRDLEGIRIEGILVQIDPVLVGGWMLDRPFDVIVHAELKNGAGELMHVERFNFESVPASTTTTTTSEASVATTTIGSTTSETTLLSVPTTEAVIIDEPTHPWTLIIVMACIGSLGLALSAIFVYSSKRRRTSVYGDSTYNFETELVDFHQKQQEDLDILTRLGEGANPAFLANLKN
jgi:hypothetical protein